MKGDRKKLLLLIVDDSPEDTELYRRLLSLDPVFDCSFSCAETGEEGLTLCRSINPNCILLDYNLPDINGLEFLNALLDESGRTVFPVVMLTGHGNERVAVEAMKLGSFDYLSKDVITGDALSRAVGNAVEKAFLQRQIEAQRLELERMSRYDDLTGLLNRRAGNDQFALEHSRARRFGLPLTVLMIDLDHFKTINDTHGHQMGDDVLRQTGRIISETVRRIDLGCRFGGEEFMVVMSGASPEQGLIVAERIRKRVKTHRHALADGGSLAVTASLGVATTDFPSGFSIDELVKRADEALYEAKAQGRDKVAVWDGAPVGAID